MINKIINISHNVSLAKQNGRFLADKSYAFDTVFFLSKFILHNSNNNLFDKQELRDKAIKYTEDIFQLTPGTAGAINYFIETINFLEFSNIIEKSSRNIYKICDREILEYITNKPENAYIFNYLVTYLTFKNDSLLSLFEKFCNTSLINEKERLVSTIYLAFCEKSVSIQTSGTQWSKQLVKYALIVLGFINGQNEITRELSIKSTRLTINDISLNVAGTRTPVYLPKKNDYLHNFNLDYVKMHLQNYLINKTTIKRITEIFTVSSIAESLADLKLTMLDDKANGVIMNDFEKEQYIVNTVKTRNQSIQRQFRKGLLDHNEHKCPICGFSFENFLIASHIKPYSKCDDTYDAINHFNGLLMCPNHDKLFEGAEYMTIDAKNGEIILSPAVQNSQDFKMLNGKHISRNYIDNERRHYLKWHNAQFLSKK